MAKLEMKLDTKEIQPLLCVCRLQAEIIAEFAHLVDSDKIDKLQQMFKSVNLDEPLREVQYEAFAAGAVSNCTDYQDVDIAFAEWVKDND